MPDPGKCTLIRLTPELNKPGTWEKRGLFKCFCGNEFVTRINNVTSGKTKSCGCFRDVQLRKPKIEYKKGDVIGSVIFLNRVDGEPKKPKARFLCECGNEFVTKIDMVKSGDTKSCGCKTKALIAASATGRIKKGAKRSPIKSMPLMNQEEIIRFWSKVALTANPYVCWNWQATGDRYGSVKVQGEDYKANRMAYYLHYGEDPKELHVLHSCDNPACCNPNHLSLGTHWENMQDMKERGRARKKKTA